MVSRSGKLAIVLAALSGLAVWAADSPAKPNQAAEATVHSQGKLEILEYCAVDLDAGEMTCSAAPQANEAVPEPQGKGFALWFQPIKDRVYAQPRNKAAVSGPANTPLGKTACAAAQYSKVRLRLDGLTAGTHICVRTSQGRYSELTLESDVAPNAEKILVAYVTWEP